MQQFKNYRVYEGLDFSLELEYNTSYVAVHLPYVNGFSKRVLKALREKLFDTEEFVRVMGYPTLFAAIFKEDEKMKRLMKHMPFVFYNEDERFIFYKFSGEM